MTSQISIRILKEWVQVDNPAKIEMYESRWEIGGKEYLILLSNITAIWRYSFFDRIEGSVLENIQGNHEIFDTGAFGATEFFSAAQKVKDAIKLYFTKESVEFGSILIKEYLSKVRYGIVSTTKELREVKKKLVMKYPVLGRFYVCPFTGTKKQLWTILSTACSTDDVDYEEFNKWIKENNIEE